MLEVARTGYLFQCRGEDLFAVFHDAPAGNDLLRLHLAGPEWPGEAPQGLIE